MTTSLASSLAISMRVARAHSVPRRASGASCITPAVPESGPKSSDSGAFSFFYGDPMTQRAYVTTTIPYVNAPPHIGFALELVQADAIARYHRLLGREVRLQSGTDENAFKNVLSAEARGIRVQQLVDENSVRFRALADALDVSLDHFQRTTDPAHRRAVDAFRRAPAARRRLHRGLPWFVLRGM